MSDAGLLPSVSADRIQQLLAQQQQKKAAAAATAAAAAPAAQAAKKRTLKGPIAALKSAAKGFRNRIAARNKPCPQELTILGEFVRMEGDIETTHGRVAFEREYYPKDPKQSDDEYKQDLADAREVFCAAFKPGSKFDLNDPRYLKDANSAEKLRKGLLRRFLGLRAQLLEINAENPDGQMDEKKEMYDHLLRLKRIIEDLENNRNAGLTMNSYEPFAKTTSADLDDEENLKKLVEKFMFLVVQARTPNLEFREFQGNVNDPAGLVDLVNSVSIDGVDLKNLETLPDAFKKWFGCVEATDLEYEKLYEELYTSMIQVIEDAINTDSINEEIQEFLRNALNIFKNNEERNKNVNTNKKNMYLGLINNIAGLMGYITNKIIHLSNTAPSAGQGLDPNEVNRQLDSLNRELESTKAKLAECEAKLAAAQAAAGTPAATTDADTASLNGTIQALLQQIETITTEINKLQNESDNLDENLVNRDTQLNAYTKILERFRDKMLEMRKTIISKDADLKKLNADLTAKSKELTASAAQLAALQAQLNTLTAEKGDLNAANAAAAAALQALEAQYKKNLADKEAELQNIIAGLKTEHAKDLAALLETIRKRREETDTTVETLRTLESKRTKLLTSIGDIERMLASIEAKLKMDILNSEKKIIGLRKVEYETLKRNLEREKGEVEAKITKMEEDLKAKEEADKKAMSDLQTKLTNAQSQLEAAKKDFEAQKAAAAAAHLKETNDLKENFNAEKQKLNEELTTERANAAAAEAAHATEKANLEAEIAKVQAELEKQAKTFAEEYARLNATYTQNLAKKDLEIKKQTDEKDELKVKLAAKEDELKNLQADKTEKANALEAVRSDLEKAQTEVERLGREGAAKDAEIAKLTAALAYAEAKLQAANNAAAECNAALNALQGELGAANELLDRARKGRETLRQEKYAAEDQYNKTIADLQAQLGESAGVIAGLKAQLADARAEIGSLQQGSPAISVVPPPNQATAKRDNLLNQVQELVGKIRSGQVPTQVPASLDRLSGRLQLYARENTSQRISDYCALNLIVSTFEELLFRNPITSEKLALGQAIAQKINSFLVGKQSIGTIVLDYLESLKTFEKQPYSQIQRSPDVAGLLDEIATLPNLAELDTSAKKIFDEAFPEFKRLSGETILPGSVSYAMEFVVFILLSTYYMLRIRKTLVNEKCLVKPPQVQPAGLPAGPQPPLLLTDGSQLDDVIGEQPQPQPSPLPQPQPEPQPQPGPQDDYAILGVRPDQPLGQIARMFQYKGYQLMKAGKTVELDRMKKAYQRIRAKKLGREVEDLPPLTQRRLKNITQRNIEASKQRGAVKRNITRRQGANMFNQGKPRPTAVPGQVSGKTARYQRQGYNTRSIAASAPQQP